MKRLLFASALTLMVLSATAGANDPWEAREDYEEARKEYREAQREAWEDRREVRKDYEEDRREHAKDLREAERDYWKERAEIERDYQKDRREALKDLRKAERRWARGDYIPRDYLLEPYYVRDHREYDLAPPPRGHMWVRPHPQDEIYYLVQLATGLVSSILDN